MYPSIKDNNFNKKITDKYKKYKIQDKKKTFREICFPAKYELQLPQMFVSQFINPDSPYKGLLVYHQIGSGKTCTAVRIGEEWKYYRKIMVLVPASLVGNFRNELRTSCAGNNYLSAQERQLLKTLHPTSKEYKEIIEKSDERIDKYYNIYSYHKFINLCKEGKMNLKNTILMIDEVQNMVSEDGSFYNELYDQIHNAPNDLRIVLLSATPMFDKPKEIALTMNLLRLPKEIPVGTEFDKTFLDVRTFSDGTENYKVKNMDKFKDYIKGFISYYRGAPAYVYPEMTLKYVKCEMSEFQYSAYKTVLNSEKKSRKIVSDSINNMPNDFFIGTRMISNIAFPNKKINEEGFKALTKDKILDNLEEYSCKFFKIMTKINKLTGKAYVYSGFKEYGGLRSFQKVLDAFGYKNYAQHGEGKKRYAVWTSDEKITFKEEIKNIYNMKENLNGSKLKLLLISPSGKEGLSLFGVKQAHIIENYWNWSRMMQIIGRGSRYCSHKDLPADERYIKVYIYMAVHPKEKQSIDEYIYNLIIQKNKLINEFEKAMKESAVDCSLFHNGNTDKETKIVCDK